MKQYVTIRLAEYFFGIEVPFVREINRSLEITPVALAPDMVTGLMNLRGQIMTIIDPGVRLGLGMQEITPESRCVVLKSSALAPSENQTKTILGNNGEDLVGLLVGGVGDIVSVAHDTLEPPPPNVADIDSRFIDGVVQLDDTLLIVLNLQNVLGTTLHESEVN